ncbi:MAG: septal ring lytic transglycosylase RlpA family protein [Aliiglaciecola sp.]
MKRLAFIVLLVLINGCTSSGRYSQKIDSHPKKISRDIDFRNVTPQYEPYLPASIRPYTVLGQHYRPLISGKGYEKTGIASWYGQKFHGHLTANGETYNMFAMSAAHKTLPLPSFVRVTNLNNNKQAIVRVNDRGPFHDNRIIDLSYAAAMKIGVLQSGTAPVKVEVMHVDQNGILTVGANIPLEPATQDATLDAWFIQVAALKDENKIDQIAQGLKNLYQVDVNTPHNSGLYRLHLGPLENENHANELLQRLRRDGYGNAFRIAPSP